MNRESERAPRQAFEPARADVTGAECGQHHCQAEDNVGDEIGVGDCSPILNEREVSDAQQGCEYEKRREEDEDKEQQPPPTAQTAEVVEEDLAHGAPF